MLTKHKKIPGIHEFRGFCFCISFSYLIIFWAYLIQKQKSTYSGECRQCSA